MLKKLMKMGVIMSLMLTSVSAFAQNSGKAEYPRYSFWSNWSGGIGLDLTWQMSQHSGASSFVDFSTAWRKAINAGIDLSLMHKQNHMISTRYRLTMPTFWEPMQDNDPDFMTRYWTLNADVLVSITDWIKGYDPERMHSWYFLVGAGLYVANWPLNKDHVTDDMEGVGHVSPELNVGLGYRLNFNEKRGFFVEGNLVTNNVPDPRHNFLDWTGMNAELRIGYLRNFGVTAADQAIAAQKSMMSQENFGALNSQVAALEQQVANSKNEEKKLQRRINELENQLAEAMRNQGTKVNTAAADSLQNIINQIKADQLNFYAMPFSVQYDVNEWQVSDEEMDKVKAVARVMKDNSNVKIRVVGFADYTGSDAYNMKLSERRANEVKRLLKSYGIAEDRIEVDYKGKNAPFGDAQYALNRRVSFYRVIE